MPTDGQRVIVTGAGRGLGRHIARSFARAKGRVTIVDFDEPALAAVETELQEQGAAVLAMVVDVRDEQQVADMAAAAISRYGGIDVLVNNAAVVTHSHWWRADPTATPWPPVRALDKAFWDRVIDTNLGGTFLCTRQVLPYMEAQRAGHIINLHGGAQPGQAGVSPYVVSKEALRAFTTCVADEERAFGVCVVIVTPGSAMATEGAPSTVFRDFPAPETLGDAFVTVADLDMSYSGKLLNLKGGRVDVTG